MPDMTDRLVAGYEIQSELGRDALGAFYRARHTETGKLAIFRGFERPKNLPTAKWQRAAKHLASLVGKQKSIQNHPGVQNVVSYGQDGDLFFVFFEYFEGRSLRDILRKEGAKNLDWVIDTFTQVANTLDHAAEHGVFHSDLNHYNIWINSADLTVQILNFGLGRARSKRNSPYLAPEQLEGSSGDWRADAYSMGVLIYQCLSGKRPFEATDEDELRDAIANKTPAPLYTQHKSVQDVIAKLLRKDPDRRYTSCIEALNDLREGNSPVDVGEVPDKPANMTGVFMLTSSFKKIPSSFTRSFKRRTDALDVEMQGALDEMQAQFRQKKQSEKAQEGKSKYKRHLWKLVPLFLFVWIIVHAVQLPSRYRFAQVVKIEGTAEAVRGNATETLSVGQWLDGREVKAVRTSENSTLVLDLNGTRVKLGPNSALVISELGYNDGSIRSFVLKRGRMWARVKPLRGRNAKFEIVCKGTKVRVKGTDFTVAAADNGAEVSTLEGQVKVDTEKDSKPVMVNAGEKLETQENMDTPKPEKLTAEELKALETKDIEAAHDLMSQVDSMVNGVQESTVVPAVNSVLALTGYKTEGKMFYQEIQAVVLARGAMEGIAKSIQTNSVEDVPHTLNLQTLEELGMPEEDRKNLLKYFEGDSLLSYKPLPNSGYEITGRAKDTKHTLIHAKNARVWAGED